ncbi:50S ribosomal protein L16 [Candidatus Dojkabacteria bacterium]|nr:50S ribosomal protein L16 [Candidatus Dojkabacteria bacterium]
MLQPKKRKYRKSFQPKMKGVAYRGSRLTHGDYGLKSMGRSWLTSRQIEAARKAIVREVKRKGKLWIKVFPHTPVTSKPSEVGMGKGKGEVDQYVLGLKPGRIIFELGGVPKPVAKEALRKAAQKLPVICKFISKD